MASIRERPSTTPGEPPSWRVEWRMGGRGGRAQSVTCPTIQLAEAAAALAKSRDHMITDVEVYRAVFGTQKTPDVSPYLPDLAAEWLKARRKDLDVQSDTIDGYEQVIKLRILPYFQHHRVSQVDGDTRRNWLDWLAKQPKQRGKGNLSAGSIRIAHGILHSIFDFAVPKWLPANPLAHKPGSRKRTAGLPQFVRYDAVFLTPGELQIFRDACGPRLIDMVEVDAATGLRVGELLVLRVGVDATITDDGCVIYVRRALKKDGSIGQPKSRNSRRDVEAGANTAEILLRLARGKRRGDLFFTAPKGGLWRPGNLNRRFWRPAVGKAMRCTEHPPPLPPQPKTGPRRSWRPDEVSTCACPTRLHRTFRFHDLRHTHVSACVADKWDQMRVSRRVGHASIQTTIDIYGHLWRLPSEQLDSLERLLLLADDEEA